MAVLRIQDTLLSIINQLQKTLIIFKNDFCFFLKKNKYEKN
jgi:hypothetical protein